MLRYLLQIIVLASIAVLPLDARAAPRTAEDYLAAGDDAGARDALARLVAGRPDAALHLAQLEALILLRDGRTAEAAQAFRTILSAEPRYAPARRGLTEALARQGDLGAAAWHAERLLAATPDEGERAALAALVTAARTGAPQGVALRFALLPSSNARRGTDAETVIINGLPFEIDDDARRKGGVGLFFGLSAWSGRAIAPNWTATLGASADAKLYGEGIDDEANLALRLDLARSGPRRRLSFGPRAEVQFNGGAENRRRLGIDATLAQRIGAQSDVTAGLTHWWQWYPDAPFRDGTLTEGHVGWRSQISATSAVLLQLPYEVERTGRDHLDRIETGVVLGLEREWRGGMISVISADWSVDDYRGQYPGFLTARRDEVTSFSISLRHRSMRIDRFIPEVSYTFTDHRSNIPFHAYQAHDLGLALSTRF